LHPTTLKDLNKVVYLLASMGQAQYHNFTVMLRSSFF
jgi:hypothetical protein